MTFADAFSAGYELGYAAGHDIGERRGYERHGLEVTAALTGVRQALGGPTQAELNRRRTAPRICECGRCSTCARNRQIAYNRRVFGQDDYPGLTRAREILTALARERRVA